MSYFYYFNQVIGRMPYDQPTPEFEFVFKCFVGACIVMIVSGLAFLGRRVQRGV